jgi:hypothetical protein
MVNAFFACRSFDAQKMGGNVLRELLELKRGLSETILIRLTLWDTLYQQISCQKPKYQLSPISNNYLTYISTPFYFSPVERGMYNNRPGA